jgi:hypothetical protein
VFWFDFLTALITAAALSAVFVAILGWRRPGADDASAAGGTALFFFLILFLATWVGGMWIYPFGPVFFGGYLFPFLLVGLVVALVLAAAVPTDEERWRWRRTAMAGMSPPMNPPPGAPAPPSTATATTPEGLATAAAREERARDDAFGAFFWVLLGVLGLAILFTYLV